MKKRVAKEHIGYVEFFAGIGVTHMALERVGKRLGIDFQAKAISEIDKNAVKAYGKLHSTSIPNYGDVTKVDFDKMWNEVNGFDLCSWTFPCTNISTAGDQSGFEEGEGNASSLFWELKRMFKTHKPKMLILENVASILNKRNSGTFNKIVKFFEDEGYFVKYGIFNAADYGIPQHRERLFMICTLGEEIKFDMPKKKSLKFKLSDILEKDVEEHYYLKKLKKCFVDKSMSRSYEFRVHNPSHCEIAYTMTTRAGRISENFIFEKDLSKNGTIRINPEGLKKNGITRSDVESTRIRTLTKKEAMLLTGLSDEDIKKLEDLPKTVIYKLMGNAIVVDALEEFLYEYFKAYLSQHTKTSTKAAKNCVSKKGGHSNGKMQVRQIDTNVFMLVHYDRIGSKDYPRGKKQNKMNDNTKSREKERIYL